MKFWLYYTEIETGAKNKTRKKVFSVVSVSPVGVCHNMWSFSIQAVSKYSNCFCMLIQCDVSATICTAWNVSENQYNTLQCYIHPV